MESVQVEPLKYYNYALLHTRGLGRFFDTMRYDRAFFARRSDVENIKQHITSPPCHLLVPFSILLCKYDYKGVTQPSWTHERLQSWQSYETASDVYRLLELNSAFTDLRPRHPLRYRWVEEVTDTLPRILDIMYLNKAVPAEEIDATTIEQAFYRPTEAITVNLLRFTDNNTDTRWDGVAEIT